MEKRKTQWWYLRGLTVLFFLAPLVSCTSSMDKKAAAFFSENAFPDIAEKALTLATYDVSKTVTTAKMYNQYEMFSTWSPADAFYEIKNEQTESVLHVKATYPVTSGPSLHSRVFVDDLLLIETDDATFDFAQFKYHGDSLFYFDGYALAEYDHSFSLTQTVSFREKPSSGDVWLDFAGIFGDECLAIYSDGAVLINHISEWSTLSFEEARVFATNLTLSDFDFWMTWPVTHAETPKTIQVTESGAVLWFISGKYVRYDQIARTLSFPDYDYLDTEDDPEDEGHFTYRGFKISYPDGWRLSLYDGITGEVTALYDLDPQIDRTYQGYMDIEYLAVIDHQIIIFSRILWKQQYLLAGYRDLSKEAIFFIDEGALSYYQFFQESGFNGVWRGDAGEIRFEINGQRYASGAGCPDCEMTASGPFWSFSLSI